MVTTPHLGLTVWNLTTDPYDHSQLADNWARVDEHDHTPGKGKLITTAAIAFGAITSDLLSTSITLPASSVGSGQIADASIGLAKLAADALAFLVPTGTVLPYAGVMTNTGSVVSGTGVLDYGAPSGFVWADGKADYDGTSAAFLALWGRLQTTYGGTGQSAFGVPSLCRNTFASRGTGRLPLGRTLSGTGSTLGSTGGAIDHTHAIAHTHPVRNPVSLIAGDYTLITPGEMPGAAHNADDSHTVNKLTGVGSPGVSGVEGWFFNTEAASSGTSGLGNPPFQAINYIIKL